MFYRLEEDVRRAAEEDKDQTVDNESSDDEQSGDAKPAGTVVVQPTGVAAPDVAVQPTGVGGADDVAAFERLMVL